ncbi:hypothetical protein Y032_0270g868 [Ancylostoma ceylanicum]|uniref:Uncharacterized protein n=1 Tax=Ancylostoma ceylanicum TaxID=53326 RepID=A0A016S9N2_9BILA|nr:hypothetical protein Y032_0270g868 [Ancylostoma ceylanicum]
MSEREGERRAATTARPASGGVRDSGRRVFVIAPPTSMCSCRLFTHPTTRRCEKLISSTCLFKESCRMIHYARYRLR